MTAARQAVCAGAVYLAASALLFGRGVVTHPSTTVVGDAGADKTLYMWAFAWWPHAIAHLHDPLDVDVAWMPHGFDLGLGTAGGGLALLACPLTQLAGPVVSYNAVALLAPALAATAAFALARELTGRFTPSLVGGWMFGFSSYMFGHLLGHLPLAFVAPIPVAPTLVLLRHREALGRRAFVAVLACVLAFEFMIVTQLFFTLVLVGSIAAAGAWFVWRDAVGRTIVESAAAVVLATLLVSPVLLYAIVSGAAAPARSPFAESADVLNFVLPTHRTWAHAHATDVVAARFTGTGAELGAYVGLPFLALALLAVRRTPGRLLLAGLTAVVGVLSLGTRVKVAGVVVGIGPWAVLTHFPLVGSALPVRLTVYTSLCAALLVALALADRPSPLRLSLAVAGVALTLPNLGLPTWHSAVPRPEVFSSRAELPAGATVLVLPYGPAGWSMLWQAQDHFRFRLVGGHFALRVTPEERAWADVYRGVNGGRVTPRRLRAFLAAHGVSRIVVTPGTRPGARRLVRVAVGAPGRHVADSVVYALRRRDDESPAEAGLSRTLVVRG